MRQKTRRTHQPTVRSTPKKIAGAKMTTLESDGFLSEEAEEGYKKILDAYKDVFTLARKTNQEAMNTLRAMHTDWNDRSRIIVAALYSRIVETYQAILLLLNMGMVAQARMLVRTGLEALFSMAAIVKDHELVQSYVAQHYGSVIQALRAAKRWKQKTLRGRLDTEKIDELIAQNQAELEATKNRKLKVWQWAEKAGLDDFYNVFYVENSSAVHSDVWALNDYMKGVPGEELGIYFGPTDIGLYHALRSAATMLLTGIETIGKAHNLQLDDRIEEIRGLWLSLDEAYYDES